MVERQNQSLVTALADVFSETQTPEKGGLLGGQVAVVTGASSGIGRAIAITLGNLGATLCAIGRDEARLEEVVQSGARRSTNKAFGHSLDLVIDDNIEWLYRWLNENLRRVDILVHSSGVIREGRMEQASLTDFDLQYHSNVRAPYLLTKTLLPMLKASQGQVVFINSTVGLSAKRANIGQFAATQHALRAIADSLREELNPDGVRILTIHAGRTATRRQQVIYQAAGAVYQPELLLQAEDNAIVVANALLLPRTAEVTDINIRPMRKNPSPT